MLKTSIVVAGLLIATPALALTEADYYYNPYTGGQTNCPQGGTGDGGGEGADTCRREIPRSTPIRRDIVVTAYVPAASTPVAATPLRTVAKVRAIQHHRMSAVKPVHHRAKVKVCR